MHVLACTFAISCLYHLFGTKFSRLATCWFSCIAHSPVSSGGFRRCQGSVHLPLSQERETLYKEKDCSRFGLCLDQLPLCRSHAFDLPTIARTTLVLPIFTPCLKKRNTLTAAAASEKIREEIALKVIYSHVRMHKQGVEIIFNKIQTIITSNSGL